MFDGPLTLGTDPAERRARVRLARSRRIGPATFLEALQHFGSAGRACRELKVVTDSEIAREEQALADLGGQFLVLGDVSYPAALAAIPDPPPVLSAIGDAKRCWRGRCWRSSARAKRRWPAGSSRPIWRPPLGRMARLRARQRSPASAAPATWHRRSPTEARGGCGDGGKRRGIVASPSTRNRPPRCTRACSSRTISASGITLSSPQARRAEPDVRSLRGR